MPVPNRGWCMGRLGIPSIYCPAGTYDTLTLGSRTLDISNAFSGMDAGVLASLNAVGDRVLTFPRHQYYSYQTGSGWGLPTGSSYSNNLDAKHRSFNSSIANTTIDMLPISGRLVVMHDDEFATYMPSEEGDGNFETGVPIAEAQVACDELMYLLIKAWNPSIIVTKYCSGAFQQQLDACYYAARSTYRSPGMTESFAERYLRRHNDLEWMRKNNVFRRTCDMIVVSSYSLYTDAQAPGQFPAGAFPRTELGSWGVTTSDDLRRAKSFGVPVIACVSDQRTPNGSPSTRTPLATFETQIRTAVSMADGVWWWGQPRQTVIDPATFETCAWTDATWGGNTHLAPFQLLTTI